MKKYDIGLSVFFSLLGLAVILFARDLKTAEQGFGAGSWPTFLGAVLILLSAVLLAQTLAAARTAPPGEAGEAPIHFTSPGMKRVYGVVAVLAVFCAVLKWAGFYLACAAMIPAVMRIMGEKRPLFLAGVTAGVLLAVYAVFGLVLHTPLPQGMLFR